MLANKYRLTNTKDFEAVKDKGRRYSGSFLSLGCLKRKKDSEPSRFGFVVSTKVSKNASIRNRIKRALREAVRQSLAYVEPSYNCVFIARPEAIKKYTTEIMSEVGSLLKKANLMK